MAMSVGVLDHFNIRTRDLDSTVHFYENIMGLEKGPRPNFAFPGAWMYSEGKAVVHIVDISKTDEPQKPDSGVVHHVAFVSRGFDGMKQRLSSKGMPFDARQVPGGELWQRASAGELSAWEASDDGALALTIVLDQFPRNMFRGESRAFSSDSQARDVAARAIARGADVRIDPQLDRKSVV